MVNEFLRTCFSPERRELLLDAIDVMTDFNLFDVPNELDNLLTDNSYDLAGWIENTNRIINEGLLEILNAHTVVCLDLTHDTKLLTNMCKALHAVQSEYDPSYIKSNLHFDLDESNEALDVYVAMVVLLTDSDEHDVYEAIFSISDTLIENISNLMDVKDIALPPNDNDEYITRYRKYLQGRRTGIVFDLVRGGVQLGSLGFSELVTLIMDNLDTLNKNDLIFELISLILISEAEPDEFVALVDKAAHLFADTEAEAKMLGLDIRNNYLEHTGVGM